MILARHGWLPMLGLTLSFALPWVPAQAAEVAGVTMPETTVLEGEPLQLNGVGTRNYLVFSIYAVGIYLPHRSHRVEEVLAMPGPKRIHLQMRYDVPSDRFVKAMETAFARNSDAATLAELRPRIDRLKEIILAHKSTGKHGIILLDWRPKSGVHMSFNGVPQGQPIPGEDFFRALLRNWLGDNVHDEKLREALLGKAHA